MQLEISSNAVPPELMHSETLEIELGPRDSGGYTNMTMIPEHAFFVEFLYNLAGDLMIICMLPALNRGKKSDSLFKQQRSCYLLPPHQIPGVCFINAIVPFPPLNTAIKNKYFILVSSFLFCLSVESNVSLKK